MKNKLELSKERLLKAISSVGDFLAYDIEVFQQIVQHCTALSQNLYSYLINVNEVSWGQHLET